MNRWDVINTLVKKINATKYLEIGVAENLNFDKINCKYKVSVDPNVKNCTFHITSNDFFNQNEEKFDIVFIDGLHHMDQVYADVVNSLKFLSNNGYIVCHDMNPYEEIMQRIPRETIEWTGDCWKAWVKLRTEQAKLSMYVVDTDYGCGVITRGEQELLVVKDDLTYENLEKNRDLWLNIKSKEEFLNL